jgi:uncharacterized protein
MDPLDIIGVHYQQGTALHGVLVDHSRRVRDKALAVAMKVAHLSPDLSFIEEAAMLHDIGIQATAAKHIFCTGTLPYVCHGVIGGHMLTAHGLERHALVCERHVGAGLSRTEILAQNLPLPQRDMLPVSLEEIIICYADKFFSKNRPDRELAPGDVMTELGHFGFAQTERFRHWHFTFSGEILHQSERLSSAPDQRI